MASGGIVYEWIETKTIPKDCLNVEQIKRVTAISGRMFPIL